MAGLLDQLRRNEGGSVAVLFALIAIPVIGITAAAIDYARASRTRDTLQRAADAAVMAASDRLLEDRSVIEGTIRAFLAANLPPTLRELPFDLKIPSDRASLELSFQTSVPTTLLAVVGVTQLDVSTSSRAVRPKPHNPGLPDPVAGTSSDPGTMARAVDSLAPSLFSGGKAQPDAAQIQDAAAAMQRVLKDQLGSQGRFAGPAATSSQDLRQVTQEIGRQIRQLEQQGGLPQMNGASQQDVQRLLRELQR